MQHCNSQPAEDPEGVENLYAYQKGVQIEVSLENAVSEIEIGMGMEGFYCPPLLKPSEGVFKSYTMLWFLPLSSSSGFRQARADAAQCKSYDRVLLG